jgi:DNA-binding transcriptional ArsR family regulator
MENTVCYFAKSRNNSHMPVRKKTPAEVAAVFKALGHPARVKMVRELVAGEKCVCDLVAAAGLGWSTVSRHLSVLREAGVVNDEKRGQQVIYRLELPCVGRFMDCLEYPARFPEMHASCCGD